MPRPHFVPWSAPKKRKTLNDYYNESGVSKKPVYRKPFNPHQDRRTYLTREEIAEEDRALNYRLGNIKRTKTLHPQSSAAERLEATKAELEQPWMVFGPGGGPPKLEYEKTAYRHPANIADRKAVALEKRKKAATLAARVALIAAKKRAFYASPVEIAKRKAIAKRKLAWSRFFKDYEKLYGNDALHKLLWKMNKKKI